jgi:hypothetical protein
MSNPDGGTKYGGGEGAEREVKSRQSSSLLKVAELTNDEATISTLKDRGERELVPAILALRHRDVPEIYPLRCLGQNGLS